MIDLSTTSQSASIHQLVLRLMAGLALTSLTLGCGGNMTSLAESGPVKQRQQDRLNGERSQQRDLDAKAAESVISENLETPPSVSPTGETASESPPDSMPQNAVEPIPLPAPMEDMAIEDQAKEGTDSDDVSRAQLITGAYLMNCLWTQPATRLSCMVKPSGHSSPLPADKVQVSLTAANGMPLKPILDYDVQATSQGDDLEISVTLKEGLNQVGIKLLQAGHPEHVIASLADGNLVVPGPTVTIFDDLNYAGASQSFGIGSYALAADFPSFPHSFASLKIPAGLAVQLCLAPAAGGCVDFYGDVANLHSLAGQAVALRVYASEPFITLFVSYDWADRAEKYGVGVHTYDTINMKDSISGFHIPAGLDVSACTSTDGTPPCYVIPPGIRDVWTDLNDRLRFLQIKTSP